MINDGGAWRRIFGVVLRAGFTAREPLLWKAAFGATLTSLSRKEERMLRAGEADVVTGVWELLLRHEGGRSLAESEDGVA